ncbi:SIMPL domain-containing protein [Streptomyces sp. NPDC050418]|uniref:SIMPL domain-containing protein n=1 Tax=Streptomyces sp. NPDC050418 TaxID=3365612 RepID=UPI00379ACB12
MDHLAEPDGAAVPYGTPGAPRLAVTGEARLEVDPEIARIHVTVNSRDRDRRKALDDLTRRNAQVLDLVKSYAEAVEQLQTGSLSLRPQFGSKGRGENVRSYHGHVLITAVLGDFTALGELVTRLADLDLTSVDGPWWELRPDSPVHGEARNQAVREAVQRARAYAAALDTRLAALVELADIGAEEPRPQGMPGLMRARSAAYGGEMAEDAAAPLDLEPRRQTVYARVNARFTMHPPQL